MHDIYERAAKVTAWLGRSYDRSQDVIKVISAIAQEDDDRQRRQRFLRVLDAPDIKFVQAYKRFFERT